MNTLFPGRADYTGPTAGLFGFLHHEIIMEFSHDVMQRVRYIKRNKPTKEIKIRLNNMIYLGGSVAATKYTRLYDDYVAKYAMLYNDYVAKNSMLYDDYVVKNARLYADYRAKFNQTNSKILAYIKIHIPDCAWDGESLVFS